MGNLSNLYISQSYQSLIHLGNDSTVQSSLVGLQDGLGNPIGVAVNATGDLSISGSFTASLQSGYTWVGDINGKTKTVPTSSFGGGGTTDLTSLNAFTASQNTKDATLGIYTGSVDTKFTTIGTQSGSWINTSLNTFTASQETKNNTLGAYTASNDTKWNTLGSESGSWVNVPLTSLNAFTASQETKNNTLATYTGSVNSSLTQLNTFTSSQNTKDVTLGTYTGSVDTKFNTIGTQSGSWENVPLTSLNAFTASQQLLNDTFATTGSNTFTGQQNIQNTLVIEDPSTPLYNTTFAQDSITNKLIVNQTGANVVQFNSINVEMSQLTASLQQGYVWVGDSTGRTTTVSTSSFGGTTDISALNTFTASQETKNSTLATYTGSIDTKFNTLGTQSGSWITNSQTSSMSVNFAVTSSKAQDLYVNAKNTTPNIITKGSIVRITGADGNNPTIGLADWTNDSFSANTLGMAANDIAVNGFADVVVQGRVIGLNTNGFTAGQNVFLGPSGSIVAIVPTPYHEVRLGQVLRANINNGSIYLTIDNGYELTELHDVNIVTASLANNQLLAYDSASTLWVNKSISQLGIATTGSNTFTGTNSFQNITAVSASFQYVQSVTGSSVNIGESFIVLNNDTPVERYAGIIVVDSGSVNTTASFQFDGQTNDWFYEYSNDGGVTTDHGVALFGPEYSVKGSPAYLSNNRIPKADGTHHLNDSSIYDDGTTVSVGTNLNVTGSISSNGTSVLLDGALSQLNSFTSSQETKNSTLATYTGSVDTKFSTIGSQSGSWLNIPLDSLNQFTQSQESKNNDLGSQSGSWNQAYNSTLALTTYTQSADEKFNTIGTQSGSWFNGALNSFTQSQETKNSTLATYTGSVDTKFNTIGSQSGSWENVPLTSLNAFTASQEVLNSTFITTGSATANQAISGALSLNTTFTTNLPLQAQDNGTNVVPISYGDVFGTYGTEFNYWLGTNFSGVTISGTGITNGSIAGYNFGSNFEVNIVAGNITNGSTYTFTGPALQTLSVTGSVIANSRIGIAAPNGNTIQMNQDAVGAANPNGQSFNATPGAFQLIDNNNGNRVLTFAATSSVMFNGGGTWRGGPQIAIFDDSVGDVSTIGFQSNENWTDGRVTILTPLVVEQGIIATGSAQLQGFTSSLQQGFTFVGNSSGRTTTVATSSFATNITALNAFTASQIVLNNQFADTGSNTFNGNQIVNGLVTQNITAPATDTQRDFVTVTGASVGSNTYNYVNQGFINYPSFGEGYQNTFAIEYYDSLSYIYGSEFLVNGKRVGGTILASNGLGAASFRIQELSDGTTFGNMYADDIQLGEFANGTKTRIGIGHAQLPLLQLQGRNISVTGSLTISGSINTSVIPLTITSNTASLNASSGSTFQLNLVSGSQTRLEVSGTRSGQTINLLVSQSATGPGTLVFGAGIEQPSGSFYSASQVANGEDILTMATFINANRVYIANVKNFI